MATASSAARSRSHHRSVPRLVAGTGIHLGLLIVCGSAAYTGWQRSIVTLPQWAVMLAVAVALLVGGLTGRLQRTWVRLALALAGLLCLKLSYDPQITAIPRLAEGLPPAFTETYPSIALVGIVILFLSWVAYRSTGGEHGLGVIPMRWSSLLAAALVTATAAVAYMLLHQAHDLAPSAALRPALMAAQAGCLVAPLLSSGGGPVVGRAPHVYLALALIAAFARNMAFPME